MSISFDPKYLRFSKVAGGVTTLNTGLVSYYKLEEASGTLMDSVGSNHFDTISGTPTYHATGKSNYGLNFSNSTDGINLATAGLNATSAASLSFWVNFSSVSSAQCLFRSINSVSPYTTFEVWVDTNLIFDVNDTAGNNHTVSHVGLSTTTWYHIVCVAEVGSPIRIYVNNARTNSGDGNLANNLYAVNEQSCIGNAGTGYSFPALGIIDEVGWWTKALTDAEVAELYNSGNGKFYLFS